MQSKVKFVWLVVAGLAACGGDDEAEDRPAQQAAARRDSVVRQPVYPEAEAAEIFRALNAGEVAAARVARERSLNDDILRFANVMISDHTAMTQMLDSLLPAPADTLPRNAEARQLREQSARMIDSLWALQGGFNNTYMELQVRDHERALQLLDTALIPSARTPELKRLLTQLRPAVAAHLQRARQIWTARMAAESETTTRAPQPAPSPATPPAQRPPATEPARPTPQPAQPVVPAVPRDTPPDTADHTNHQ